MVQQAKKSVQFKTIEIFEYPITLGDNPSVTSGAPLTIEWEVQRKSKFLLEYFERHRPAYKQKNNLRISGTGRKQLLLRCGFSDEEIINAALEATEMKKERLDTILFLKKQVSRRSKQQQKPQLSNVSPLHSFSTDLVVKNNLACDLSEIYTDITRITQFSTSSSNQTCTNKSRHCRSGPRTKSRWNCDDQEETQPPTFMTGSTKHILSLQKQNRSCQLQSKKDRLPVCPRRILS
jgi:hypothetical protein